MALLATMALVLLTVRLAPMSPPIAPPSPEPPVDSAPGSAAALAGLLSPGSLPAGRGQAVLIKVVRSFTVEFLLCQKASAGLRSCAASFVCRSCGMVNKARVVMKPWYSMVLRGFRPKFLTSEVEMFKPSAIAIGR